MRLAIVAMLVMAASVTANQPVSSLGYYVPRPIGNEYVAWAGQTGMSGCEPGYVIARGQLQAQDYQLVDGNFDIANLGEPAASVTMPRGAVALSRARDLNLKDVELILRELPQRTLERLR